MYVYASIFRIVQQKCPRSLSVKAMRVKVTMGATSWDGTGPIYTKQSYLCEFSYRVTSCYNVLLILSFSTSIRQTTTSFIVIIGGHTIYKETNILKFGDNIGGAHCTPTHNKQHRMPIL